MTARIVDVDDVATWPPAVRQYADRWARQLRGSTRYAGDLDVPLEEADAFLRLFQGSLLRAIHCTRLLDHERQWIAKRGLREASRELMAERIHGAHSAGAITAAERDILLSGHALAGRERALGNREGQVCLIASRTTLEREPDAVEPLLRTWGGEVIYMPQSDRARLRSIGKPTLVVAALDIASLPDPPRHHHFTPELNRLFVAKRLNLVAGGDVFYRASVPAGCVLAVLQPGDREYDQHQHLPRT